MAGRSWTDTWGAWSGATTVHLRSRRDARRELGGDAAARCRQIGSIAGREDRRGDQPGRRGVNRGEGGFLS